MALQEAPSSSTTLYVTLSATLALLLAVGTYIYLTDAGNDIARWLAEKYFKAAATAQKAALQKAGATAAEGFLKDQLKKNPVVSNEELNDIQEGLGDEAAERFGKFGKGGLGGSMHKAFDDA